MRSSREEVNVKEMTKEWFAAHVVLEEDLGAGPLAMRPGTGDDAEAVAVGETRRVLAPLVRLAQRVLLNRKD